MEIRRVPRVFKSQTTSCHDGRNKQHVFSLLPQWAALHSLLGSHSSLEGVGHNCRLASCGRHGSELLGDLVQPVPSCGNILSLAWAGGVAIRNTWSELTAEATIR
jgi:hypothetical protein